ncbi:hypothetical protein EGR52_02590 [bacterium]|nr:hypothetical protein [bacterium]
MKKAFKILLIIYIIGSAVYIFNNKSQDIYLDKQLDEDKKEVLSMMLETEAGSGKYQETTSSSWPEDGYVFNDVLSRCENGSTLSWDETKKIVVMSGNISDKCYMYFDKRITLVDYVKDQYTGTQGKNNLYLHDNSLSNGAKDNSYRYAGPSETTNNFVCFGYDSQDGSCPTDNLYRIIGIFGDQVKLIKYDYAKSILLGTDGYYGQTYQAAGFGGTNKGQNSQAEIGGYYWGIGSANSWRNSYLNTVNLNKNYINNIGTKWSEKISDHTWKVGGNTYSNIIEQTASNAYQNEINKSDQIEVNAKVGLMYVSDYGYAVSFSSWSTRLEYYNEVIANNWMYMGLREWTLAPQADSSNIAFSLYDRGHVNDNYVNKFTYAVRPVFYLKSKIVYGGGSGTAAKPILIN